MVYKTKISNSLSQHEIAELSNNLQFNFFGTILYKRWTIVNWTNQDGLVFLCNYNAALMQACKMAKTASTSTLKQFKGRTHH